MTNKYRNVNILHDSESLITEITAEVKGHSNIWYSAKVSINEEMDDIDDYECECLSYYQTCCMCKHCVTLALIYQAYAKEKQTAQYQTKQNNYHRASDVDISKLIQRCSPDTPTDNRHELKHNIRVEPSFRLDYTGKLSMELRIGSSRMIIVKDIPLFLAAIEQGKELCHSKTLSFVHQRDAFTPEALEWIDFAKLVLRENGKANQLDTTYIPSSLSTNSANRVIPLGVYCSELCLKKYIASGKPLPGLDRSVTDGDPKISMTIEKEQQGAILTIEPIVLRFFSLQTYVEKDHILYRCSPDFQSAAVPILSVFSTSLNHFHKEPCKNLYLSPNDFRIFCKNVLPTISRFFDVTLKDISFDEFAPEPAEFQMYLTTPDTSTVPTADIRCTVTYGAQNFDLFDTSAAHTSYSDINAENKLLSAILHFFPEDLPDNSMRRCSGEEAIAELLNEGIPLLREAGELFIDEKLRSMKLRPPCRVSFGVSMRSGLLDIDIQSDLPDPAEIAAVLGAYRKKKKYYRLKNGELLCLDTDSLGLLNELCEGLNVDAAKLKNGTLSLPQYRAAYLDETVNRVAGSAEVRRDATFRKMIRELHDSQNSEFDVPSTVKASLRGYQTNGFRWLATLAHYGLGGILADDMGLGKTLQILAYIEHSNVKTLVVCPASLVYNWESEIHRFVPGKTVFVITGTAEVRQELIGRCQEADITVTSYDLLKRDITHYESIQFDCMVIDEAQYIKNGGTLAAKAVKSVSASVRFALTGTPIENRLSDLWSIFDFILPGYLYPYKKFRTELEKPITTDGDEAMTQRLKAMISPFILRRKKQDVLKDLPDKLEQVIYTKMTEKQEALYRALEGRLLNHLMQTDEGTFTQDRIKILAELTRLRQICCSPELCYDNYNGGSGKVDVCMELLHNAIDAGHKVLVFSQFTTMLEKLIAVYAPTGEYLYLSGKNTKEQRKTMIERFQTGNIPVFFISLKAGGTGLNLTAADTILHVDPWWNIAAENQATDRAHRIGQHNTVTVFKAVTSNTIEERILALQEQKAALSEKVLDGQQMSGSTITREELIQLLTADNS